MKINEQEKLVKRTLRIPRSLYDEIEKAAEEHQVSVNAEIVDRLTVASMNEKFDRISGEIGELKALIRDVLSAVG